jgi:hypothetical protein
VGCVYLKSKWQIGKSRGNSEETRGRKSMHYMHMLQKVWVWVLACSPMYARNSVDEAHACMGLGFSKTSVHLLSLEAIDR